VKPMVVVGALVCLAAGCGPTQLDSRYKDRDIVIDGKYKDWAGALQTVAGDDISVGLMNDGTDLCIALIVEDRQVRRQIAMSGLFLWFDSNGGKTKEFGLRFPLGMEEVAGEMPPPDMAADGQRPPPAGGLRPQAADGQKPQQEPDDVTLEMEVFSPTEQVWRRFGLKELQGIEAAASRGTGPLVLEFRVPLAKTGPFGYGIGAAAGTPIGVGLETPEIDMEAFQDKMGPPDGGGEGGSDRRPPSGGGMGGGQGPPVGGGERPSAPDPIKVWTRVQLAKAQV
jgi:hypothetical protein